MLEATSPVHSDFRHPMASKWPGTDMKFTQFASMEDTLHCFGWISTDPNADVEAILRIILS